MLNYKTTLAAIIAPQVEGYEAKAIYELLEYPPNPEMGDLSMPCFKFSKALRKAPQMIAEQLKEKLIASATEEVQRVEAIAGYLNIYLNPHSFAREVVSTVLSEKERYGSQNIGEGKTIVIDYSSPNIAKHFHIGHLRSTMIGNSLYQIFGFLGYRCVGINHLGDWGTQFGKLMVSYLTWGNEATVREDGVTELQRLYVLFHEEAENKPELENEARAWFVKLEHGDAQAQRLWKWFVDISLQEYNKIYELLGVSFDSYTGESFYNDKMAVVVEQLKDKKLLEEDDGAMLVRLDDYNMPPALMIKTDGSTLYHTRDVTAALYRKETYDFDKAIYVTDAGQSLHFQQWFKIIELMGYEWADKLQHVSFGKVSLEGAKLSTRKGNIVMLEELLRKAIEVIADIIEQKNPGMANKETVARQVGVGAIIFNDLSTNRIKDVVFSWEEALNFDGETGPYVQYTHARTCSLLRKAVGGGMMGAGTITDTEAGTNADAKVLATSKEWIVAVEDIDVAKLQEVEALNVIKQLYFFGERIQQAMNKLEPSVISRYLVDLAQSFNRFYHECPILKVEDEKVRTARLALVKSVQITLQNGLKLIGLEAPEEI